MCKSLLPVVTTCYYCSVKTTFAFLQVTKDYPFILKWDPTVIKFINVHLLVIIINLTFPKSLSLNIFVQSYREGPHYVWCKQALKFKIHVPHDFMTRKEENGYKRKRKIRSIISQNMRGENYFTVASQQPKPIQTKRDNIVCELLSLDIVMGASP